MAIPITIKKRKVSFKRPKADAVAETSAAVENKEDSTIEPDDEEVSHHFSPVPPPVQANTPAQAAFGIIAIVAAVLFVILIIIQWTEWSYIITSFPRPIQTEQLIAPTT